MGSLPIRSIGRCVAVLVFVAPAVAAATELADRSAKFLAWVDSVDAYFDANPDLKDSSGTGWNPYQRFKWHEEQRMLDGMLPAPDARWNAVEDKKALGTPTGPTWTLLGPDGAYSDSNADHEVAGRMLDLEFDPADSGILYAAAAGGGLWRTTDDGTTWTSMTDDIAAQPVGGIGVSRDDSDILVIGTGEGTWVETAFYHGVGILRSTDGGASWETTSLSGDSWPDLGAGLGFHFVEAGPTGVEDVFLAGATDGLYRSSDAGENWALVASCDSCQFFDAKWKPGSTTTVFAAAGNGAFGTNAADSCGVWRSTDAGATWTYRIGTAQHDAHDIGKTKLGVSPDEPDWIYALYGERGLDVGDAGQSALYRSTDSGATWVLRDGAMNPEIGSQVSYNLVLLASPQDASTLLAAGTGIAVSTTGGDSTAWSSTLAMPWFKDNHAAVYHPGTDSVWIACDQGIYLSDDDGGGPWMARNETLATLQFYDIAANNRPGPFWVLGGTQDTGSHQLLPDSTRWRGVHGADGTTAAIDASTDSIAYATQRSLLYRTTNEGDTWGSVGGVNGLRPLDVNPKDGTLYRARSSQVQKSTDHGSTWVSVPNSTRPYWLSISRVNTDLVWWVDWEENSSSTVVHFTTDNGSSFETAASLPFDTGVPTKIHAHPTDSLTALVTFSSYEDVSHVAITTDMGDSWQDVTGDLPDQPVNGIVVNPGIEHHWYVGTDTGVWRSTNGGTNWLPYGQGLPHAVVYDVEIDHGRQKLIAGTHGRSAWEVDTFAQGDTLTWRGTVNLSDDFLVPEGSLLRILPNTRVQVVSGLGVRVTVEGQMLAEGTVDSTIVFTSTDGDMGDWEGLAFALEGAYSSTYGYVGSVQEISKLAHVDIEHAEVGVRITDLVAPALASITFADIDNSSSVARHILLDQTDVVLPYGKWIGEPGDVDGDRVIWDLEAPVNVVATNSVDPNRNHPGELGDDDLVDLFIDGLIRSQNTEGPDALVWFRPEDVEDTLKDQGEFYGWGGMEVHSTASGTYLRYARVSHARDGLFLAYPESCAVVDAQVHHFKEMGIRVVGGTSPGLLVDRTLIARGPSLDSKYGRWGIHAEQANALRVFDSLIYDYSHEGSTTWELPDTTGGGIRIVGSAQFCGTQPWSADSVVIRGTGLVGPGETHTGGERAAIQMDWACGSSTRDVAVQANGIWGWFHGFKITEGRDVDVRCNHVADNRIGLEFYRVAKPWSDPEVRLKRNELSSNLFRTIYVDEGIEKLALGSASSTVDRGLNRFEVDDGAEFYVFQHDSTIAGTDSLAAHQNQWFDIAAAAAESTRADVLAQSDPTLYVDRIAVADATMITGSYTIGCLPSLPSTTAPGLGASMRLGTQPGRREDVVDPGWQAPGPTAAGDIQDLPEVTRLGETWPNPTTGELRVRFAVGRSGVENITISVFDVQGRRVARLVDGLLEPGWREVQWNGRNSQGSHVAAGVYFLRFEAGDVRETRKIIRVR